MANTEYLLNLPMTRLETLLKERFMEREDIAGRILSSQELAEYSSWMVVNYGHLHGSVTESMLPYFTPDNAMTALAEEIVHAPDSKKLLHRLSQSLSVQSDESYIAPGSDISVGRMLRYYPAHWHSVTYFELYFSFSGDCPIAFQNETVTLHRGDLLITAPGIVRAAPCYTDDAVLAFYMIRKEAFERFFWRQMGDDNLLSRFFRTALESESPASYVHFETQGDAEITDLLYRIYVECQRSVPYSPQLASALMQVLFILVLQRYEGTAKLPRTADFYWKQEFSGILSYIQTHYTETGLEEVADRFHYSTRQVGRIVRDCTGKSFGELIRELKMKKAAALLREARLSQQDIATALGFSSVNSFCRSFRDYYGAPPQAWITNLAEKNGIDT